MRHKWIFERFPRWFIFGQTETMADISNGKTDVAEHVPIKTAEALIAEHNQLVDMFADMAVEFADAAPDKFEAFYCKTSQPIAQ